MEWILAGLIWWAVDGVVDLYQGAQAVKEIATHNAKQHSEAARLNKLYDSAVQRLVLTIEENHEHYQKQLAADNNDCLDRPSDMGRKLLDSWLELDQAANGCTPAPGVVCASKHTPNSD